MLFLSSSRPPTPKGAVLSRSAYTTQSQAFASNLSHRFWDKKGAAPRPWIKDWASPGHSFGCICSGRAKGTKGYLHFLLFLMWFCDLWVKQSIIGFDVFQTLSQKKGERSWVKFFSWLSFPPLCLDNYPSTLHNYGMYSYMWICWWQLPILAC